MPNVRIWDVQPRQTSNVPYPDARAALAPLNGTMAVLPPSQGRLRHRNDSHRVLPPPQCWRAGPRDPVLMAAADSAESRTSRTLCCTAPDVQPLQGFNVPKGRDGRRRLRGVADISHVVLQAPDVQPLRGFNVLKGR